jgi:hypothetical protein
MVTVKVPEAKPATDAGTKAALSIQCIARFRPA